MLVDLLVVRDVEVCSSQVVEHGAVVDGAFHPPSSADLEHTDVVVLFKGDALYQWWLRLIINLIPDVSQYYPKDYVANGFDITWGTLLFLNYILPVAGYLLPWILLGYYLMKSREIANP